MGQQKPSKSVTPPKAPPEVYHKLPGQFYRPSSSEGHHEQQLDSNLQDQPQHQNNQQPPHHISQQNGSAPPIDPSLFSMYSEPSNNGGPFPVSTQPYNMPDHSSAERPPLYGLPSLEQIATEVLDMNGGGDENGDAGLAAIQAFNRQRDGFIQAYQQQNGGLLPMNVVPPADGSVDSGVSMGTAEHKDGSSPPSNVLNASSDHGLDKAANDVTQERPQLRPSCTTSCHPSLKQRMSLRPNQKTASLTGRRSCTKLSRNHSRNFKSQRTTTAGTASTRSHSTSLHSPCQNHRK